MFLLVSSPYFTLHPSLLNCMSKIDTITFNFAKNAKLALPKARWQACRTIKRKIGRDWVHSTPEFLDLAQKLLHSPELATNSGNIIWQTDRNTVWHTQLHGQNGLFDVVYKSRPGRYRVNRCISASAMVRDAINLLAISSLGFPTTQLLAVGENRTLTHWHYAFIVTRFAEDFKQVSEILPNASYANHPWIQEAVIKESLRALANLHRHAIYHKAFKPYNIMWKESGEKAIELCLFDFETSRAILLEPFENYMIRDLFDFFRSFKFSEDALLHWVTFYLSENSSCQASPQVVVERIIRLLKEKGY